MKRNCWEVKRCGREPGGHRVADLGVCPAATEPRLQGLHEGKAAGRCCWVVAGTFCEGKVQGTFAEKFDSCSQCEFYQMVRAQEGGRFHHAVTLLKRLKER